MTHNATTAEAPEPETEEVQEFNAAGLPLPPAVKICADEQIKARFWAKVSRKDKGPNDCWEWQAAKEEKGYGRFRITIDQISGTYPTHRASFMLHHGRWPSSSMMVLHSCDNPACVNPAHLREGTAQDNQDDIDARGRRKRKGAEQWRDGRASDAILRGGSKLDPDTVRQIRKEVVQQGVKDPVADGTALLLAFDHDVREAVIANALTGKTFAWVPGVRVHNCGQDSEARR